MRAYEYRHTVSFEETNLVGNVYYTHHLRWQGRVRELFLRDHAPEVLEQLAHGLCLVTVRVACEYLSELTAFDEVLIRMTLGELTQNRITMHYEYTRLPPGRQELVARGEQQVATLQREGQGLVPVPVPTALRTALEAFR